jgi:hypothetical protein
MGMNVDGGTTIMICTMRIATRMEVVRCLSPNLLAMNIAHVFYAKIIRDVFHVIRKIGLIASLALQKDT